MSIKLFLPSLEKLFNNYFRKYALVFIIPFFLCCCITLLSYQNLAKSSGENMELQLIEKCNDTGNAFSSMISTSQMLFEHGDFFTLIHQPTPLPLDQTIPLKDAHDFIRYLTGYQNLSPYFFTLNKNNDIFLSSSHCSRDFTAYYPRFMSIEYNGQVLAATEAKEFLFSMGTKPFTFCMVDSVTVANDGIREKISNAILCITNGNGVELTPSYITVFLLAPTDLVSALLPENLVEYASVCVTERYSGNVILDYISSETSQKNFVYELEIGEYLSASISVSNSIIAAPIKPLLILLVLFLVVFLIISLMSTIRLSYLEYTRVKNLFAVLPKSISSSHPEKDEYKLIQKLILSVSTEASQYSQQINELLAQNQSAQLENLIIKGVNSPEEAHTLKQAFPACTNAFIVVILRIYAHDDKNKVATALIVNEHIKSQYSDRYIFVQPALHDAIFLFSPAPDFAISPDQLAQEFRSVASILSEKDDIFFNVAISSMCTTPADIRLCFSQAYQTLQLYSASHENIVEKFHIKLPEIHENLVDMDFLNHLYNLLLSASRSTIHDQFARLHETYSNRPKLYDSQCQQIFYAIRNVLMNVKLSISPNITEGVSLPNYSNSSLPMMLQTLEDTCMLFCDCIEASKRSHNTGLKNQILEYIQAHFTDSSLTPAAVCKEFSISEKYLFQFIKDQIGVTFSDYVERLRTNKAKEYLVETTFSNDRIATLCGFGSTTTFYRAFSRQTGVTPRVYKASHGK